MPSICVCQNSEITDQSSSIRRCKTFLLLILGIILVPWGKKITFLSHIKAFVHICKFEAKYKGIKCKSISTETKHVYQLSKEKLGTCGPFFPLLVNLNIGFFDSLFVVLYLKSFFVSFLLGKTLRRKDK